MKIMDQDITYLKNQSELSLSQRIKDNVCIPTSQQSQTIAQNKEEEKWLEQRIENNKAVKFQKKTTEY